MSKFAAELRTVPFAPNQNGQPHESDVDRSGHAIVALLHEAAQVASANCERAMEVAHKLSRQLQALEGRAKQLDAELRNYQDRAFRAEKWLVRVHDEIQDKFFNQSTAPNPGQTAHP
jgi:hypothetical protein